MNATQPNRWKRPATYLLRTAACLLMLASVVALGIFCTIRFHHWDKAPWFFYRGPISLLLLTFVLRMLFACGWKHLLPALLLLFVILGALAQGMGIVEFDRSEAYVAIGALLAAVALPALVGMAAGGLMARRMIALRSRYVAAGVAAVLLFAWPIGYQWGWRLYARIVSARAESLGKPALCANARDLKGTVIAPTLDASLPDGSNVLWCATFQAAWNELLALSGEDIHMDQEDPMVGLLNRKSVTKADLDETTYLAMAGAGGGGGAQKAATALEAKFHGQAKPELLSRAGALPPDAIMAYAYLTVNLPFQWAFEKLDYPVRFKGSNVRAFGIKQYLKNQEKERLAATQLKIFHPQGLPGVIVELQTRRQDHRLLLAQVPRLATLADTARSVLTAVAATQPQELSEWANFAVPIIDFDLTRQFAELTGKPLRVVNPSLDGVPLALAEQQIRFKLDERGALLKSEAVIATLGSGGGLTFDSPFLVLLMYAKSERPYFALWVENPELLAPF